MSEEYIYPGRYALFQAMSEFCQRNFLDSFAQEKGIFITNTTQEGLANFMSSLFFEDLELENIRKSALQIHGRNTLSGFRVNFDDIDFNLVNLLDTHRGKIVDEKNKMKLKAVTSPKDSNDQAFQGEVDYIQAKPGRVQFLQGTERTFNYYGRHIIGGLWEILIDGSRSNDARLLEQWLSRELPKNSDIQKIDQDLLTTSQTISFFDELGKTGEDKNWRFTQVTRLILRRETTLSVDEEDERLIEEANVLSGISQAILEGRELRNNSFVKQSEEGGYRFTAMTYEFEHVDQPYVKEIRAEFKKKPKVFEIALEKYSERKGVEETLKSLVLPENERVQILSSFWSLAKKVFETLRVT